LGPVPVPVPRLQPGARLGRRGWVRAHGRYPSGEVDTECHDDTRCSCSSPGPPRKRPMLSILGVLARLAATRPGRVLTVLAAVTVVLGVFAGQQTTDTELTAFAPDSEVA